jgi:hypothetical protein
VQLADGLSVGPVQGGWEETVVPADLGDFAVEAALGHCSVAHKEPHQYSPRVGVADADRFGISLPARYPWRYRWLVSILRPNAGYATVSL